jgi:hypothetical protein
MFAGFQTHSPHQSRELHLFFLFFFPCCFYFNEGRIEKCSVEPTSGIHPPLPSQKSLLDRPLLGWGFGMGACSQTTMPPPVTNDPQRDMDSIPASNVTPYSVHSLPFCLIPDFQTHSHKEYSDPLSLDPVDRNLCLGCDEAPRLFVPGYK